MADLLTPDEYADRLVRSYERFQEALALLEPTEYATARLPGGWTPTATVAHVAFWDDFQRRRMEAALSGVWAEKIPWPGDGNDARAAADASRPWDEVLAEADANRRKLVDFARALKQEEIEAVYLEDGKERPLVQQLLDHMPKHVREHAQAIYRYCGT